MPERDVSLPINGNTHSFYFFSIRAKRLSFADPVTIKIARKTFTKVMLNELGVSEESVAAMLGHSSAKHVRYYGKANEERVAKEVRY